MSVRIYDGVHGYVELSEVEARIIDVPVFQRLRRIKQLSAAWLVYPDATHTRFGHSIGALHVMSRVVDKLVRMGIVPKDDVDLLRVSALLHDIGHYPYSHTFEGIYLSRLGNEASHESLGRYLILNYGEIRDILEEYGINPREVVKILEGRHEENLYNSLLSSDIDVDRMDYLPRDALHTGVSYGLIDIDRILDTLTVDDEGNLCILVKGLQAIENLYLARLHMYQAVYYHKTIIAYEVLLRRIFERLVDELEELRTLNNINNLKKYLLSEDYVYWDDYWVHSKLYNMLKSKTVDEETKRMIKLFLDRKGLKLVADFSKFSNKPVSAEEYYLLDDVRERIVNSGVPENAVIVFADSIPVIKEEEAVKVVVGGECVNILSPKLNTIIRYIPRFYMVLRIYVDPLYSKLAQEVVRGFRAK